MSKKPEYVIYQITETGKVDPDTNKKIVFWNRIGAAWLNLDGSINGQLASLPIDGKFHIRKPKPKEDDDNEGGDDS